MIFFTRHDVDLEYMRKRVNKKGLYNKACRSLLNKLLDLMDAGLLADAYNFYCSDEWNTDDRPREFLDIDLADLFQQITFGYWVRPKGTLPLSNKLPDLGGLHARRAVVEANVIYFRCKCGRMETMHCGPADDCDRHKEVDTQKELPTGNSWAGWTWDVTHSKGKAGYKNMKCPSCNTNEMVEKAKSRIPKSVIEGRSLVIHFQKPPKSKV
jgi:hypothetical protein